MWSVVRGIRRTKAKRRGRRNQEDGRVKYWCDCYNCSKLPTWLHKYVQCRHRKQSNKRKRI
ncbi:hypothetical protein Tsubulata_019187 [Turnera subulata]|uniref:Uncharacterized protein n=1 Tax=Turnera subulata TaxID=218843 RepID=A0A9Q0G551_9ROSI|nr:hypothetical protein Tsubulata_019187 [Turnera subulata]